jgi:acetylornithine deacetylase/succinyl-diaminopimelate desuccinylase-like protein
MNRHQKDVEDFDSEIALAQVSDAWDHQIVKALSHYIEIPAKSPNFDRNWKVNGFLEQSLRDAAEWIERQRVPGLTVEVVHLGDRTPVLFFELPASGTSIEETVWFYGHMDKQPEFSGWRSDLGPWTPKYEDGKLFGRGGADDGYAVYSAIAIIQALQSQGAPHPKIVGLIETCEESGSVGIEAYLDLFGPRIGQVGLVACLDSGAGTYDQLWLTSSLRGMATGTLKVEVLDEGVHSGAASGIVPSSFRVMRRLMDRLEDSQTGRLLPASFHCEVPVSELNEARATAEILQEQLFNRFPWKRHDCGGVSSPVLPVTSDPVEALINRTWRPALSVTGADGFPAVTDAGNVLRPYSAFKLSLRLPPVVDAAKAIHELKSLLEAEVPYQARVTFEPLNFATGWTAPSMETWYRSALDDASQRYFGAPCGFIGEGGTLPLMSIIAKAFPNAQIMMCGVQGPKSNAHGPNEFLHVPYAKKLTAAVASVIAAMPRGVDELVQMSEGPRARRCS